ncbi:MAG: hypothetical protein AMXMBFR84_10550 [Candidatus Hydrogenedentota bacterium]
MRRGIPNGQSGGTMKREPTGHILTTHASRVIEERGIAMAWVEMTLSHPERQETDPSDANLKR